MGYAILLLALAGIALGPGLAVLRGLGQRRLRGYGPVERVLLAALISLLTVYGAGLAMSWARWPGGHGLLLLIAVASLAAGWPQLTSICRGKATRRLLLQSAALGAYLLLLTLTAQTFSGGKWSGDWLEHLQRAAYFRGELADDFQFIDLYTLPSRPPLQNVLVAVASAVRPELPLLHVAQLVGVALATMAAAATFALARLFVPPHARHRNRARHRTFWLPILLLCASAPVVMHTLFPWTRMLTAFFVITGLYFYLRALARRRADFALIAFAALGGGMLTHYSAGPFLLAIASHLAFAGARHITRPTRTPAPALSPRSAPDPLPAPAPSLAPSLATATTSASPPAPSPIGQRDGDPPDRPDTDSPNLTPTPPARHTAPRPFLSRLPATRLTLLCATTTLLLMLTWWLPSISRFGPAATFTSNTTIADSARLTPAQNLRKLGYNVFTTLAPHPLHISKAAYTEFFSQTSPLGRHRDYWLHIHVTTLLPTLGPLFGLPTLLLATIALARTTPPHATPPHATPWRGLWLTLLPITLALSIAVHGEPDDLGLAHICLLPLALIALAFLAARTPTLPRWARAAMLIGVLLDLALAVGPQVACMALFGDPAAPTDRALWPLSDIPYRNFAALRTLGAHTLGNTLLPHRDLLLFLTLPTTLTLLLLSTREILCSESVITRGPHKQRR